MAEEDDSQPETSDDDDGLEVEEALEGMTEDQDEVILEQAVFWRAAVWRYAGR